MKDIVREFRETVNLGALFDNHIEVVAVIESPEIVRTLVTRLDGRYEQLSLGLVSFVPLVKGM